MSDITTSTDVDWLWSRLQQARAEDDTATAAAVKARMAALDAERRYGALSDLELERRIATLQRRDLPEAISYAGDWDDNLANRQYAELNRLMAEAAAGGDQSDLPDLLAEKKRRLEARRG